MVSKKVSLRLQWCSLYYVFKEVVKRPFKVTDRLRQIRKGIVAKSLKDLMKKSVDKLGYDERQDVYLVLEEVRLTFRPRYLPMRLKWQDGTEIDDEEYFQSLPDNCCLMLLDHQDLWSPVGPQYLWDLFLITLSHGVWVSTEESKNKSLFLGWITFTS